MPPRPSRLATVLVAVAATCLTLYGLLTVVAASAWGPGNSDELVSGGADLIPWFGLSLGGTLAALGAFWDCSSGVRGWRAGHSWSRR